MHAPLLLPVLLTIELRLRYHICDLHSKFEEGRMKTTVVIMDECFAGRNTQTHTHTQTGIHSSGFISVQCHALHGTKKNNLWIFAKFTADILFTHCLK